MPLRGVAGQGRYAVGLHSEGLLVRALDHAPACRTGPGTCCPCDACARSSWNLCCKETEVCENEIIHDNFQSSHRTLNGLYMYYYFYGFIAIFSDNEASTACSAMTLESKTVGLE